MKSRLHAVAGGLALALIAAFWMSTVVVELRGDATLIAQAKRSILIGMGLLVPSLVVTGASGSSLAKGWRSPVVARKKKRMVAAAANGLVVLVPAAVLLATWSAAGRFDGWFQAVQSVELVAGATNLMLLGLNLADGLRMRRRRVVRP